MFDAIPNKVAHDHDAWFVEVILPRWKELSAAMQARGVPYVMVAVPKLTPKGEGTCAAVIATSISSELESVPDHIHLMGALAHDESNGNLIAAFNMGLSMMDAMQEGMPGVAMSMDELPSELKDILVQRLQEDGPDEYQDAARFN